MTNKYKFAIIHIMTKPISIYDAKTQLSKLINQAKAGQSVVIGAYGKPEVMLVPYVEPEQKLKIGVFADKSSMASEDTYSDLVGSDPDINKMFSDSIGKSL